MAVYAIGDIQGCDDEFGELLRCIRFDPREDRLWLVGDLVNRGPKSLEVLRRVRAMGPAVTLVLGNHDLHLLAVASGVGPRSKPGDTLAAVLAAPDRDDLLDWLGSQPVLHHDPGLNLTLVHAGFAPQWTLETASACARELESALRDPEVAKTLFASMYGDWPHAWSDDLKGVDRLRFITNCLTRLRFCNAQGHIDLKYKGTLANAPQGLYPWFRVPGRRTAGQPIVCGHWSALGYHSEADVRAIDTGCVWGGSLCAIRLDAEEPPITVGCRSSGLKVEE